MDSLPVNSTTAAQFIKLLDKIYSQQLNKIDAKKYARHTLYNTIHVCSYHNGLGIVTRGSDFPIAPCNPPSILKIEK